MSATAARTAIPLAQYRTSNARELGGNRAPQRQAAARVQTVGRMTNEGAEPTRGRQSSARGR